MNILVLDVGTTSMRGVLFDEGGRVIGTRSRPTAPLLKDDLIEQTPEAYLLALEDICAAFGRENRVDAMSLTAIRSSPTLADREGNALCNFIMWPDVRNRTLCESYYNENERIYALSGAKVNTVFSATKIRWLKDHRPDLYRKAHRAICVPNYLIHHMTDSFVTDRTYGSRWQLMNIRTLEWDDELCRLFGLDRDKLCDLVDQGTVAGRVNRSFAVRTGIACGTPVVSAGGDQQCSALGLGILAEGNMGINAGTSSSIMSLTDQPFLKDGRTICNVSALRGKYILESINISCASALNWMIRTFFSDLWGAPPDYAGINRIASQSPCGANGLYCFPDFQGCGSRDWNPNATAAFWGLRLHHTRSDMLRALLEGVAAEISKGVDTLPDFCKKAETVYVAGGMANSALFNQILTDMLGRTVRCYGDTQATAIGAYASAAVALGVYGDHASALAAVRGRGTWADYRPDPERSAYYRGYCAETERIYRCLFSSKRGAQGE